MKPLSVAFAILLSLTLIVGIVGCTQDSPTPTNGGTDGDTNGDVTSPTSPGNPAKTSPDNDSTPTFTWEPATDDSGVAGYLVSIDGADWSDIGNVTTYTCATVISDGAHTFQVRAVDGVGNKSAATTLNFTVDTTPPVTPDTAPPIISAVTAFVTYNSVTIVWTTDEPATSQVEYGLTAVYGSSTPLDSVLVTSHSINISGLDPNTTYHYRVKARDGSTNEAISTSYTFTTPDTTPPLISGVAAADAGEDRATVTWTTDEPSNSLVDYGTTVAYGTTKSDEALVTSHIVSLSGLSANTLYHYRVSSQDASQNLSVSADFTFTTDKPTVLVSGVISQNTTWTSDNIYVATANVGVPAGVTLTVEPGTTARFAPGAKLQVAGALLADGASDNTILFTRDSYPVWAGIEFIDSSGAGSVMRHCEVRYAETGIAIGSSGLVFEYNQVTNCEIYGIHISWCTSVVTHCLVSACGTGISVYVPGAVGTVELTNNTITNNGRGISVLDGPGLTVSDNNIQNSSGYDFYCWGFDGYYIAATNNWWGTTDAGLIEQKIYHYSDDLTLPQVIYQPYATVPIVDAPQP